MQSFLNDTTTFQARLDALNLADSTGRTAILLKGRPVVVPEATIQMFLTRNICFAFLKNNSGIITAVPMN